MSPWSVGPVMDRVEVLWWMVPNVNLGHLPYIHVHTSKCTATQMQTNIHLCMTHTHTYEN